MKLSAIPLLLGLGLGLLATEVEAQDHVTVDPADVVELEKFSACRRLKNNAANPVFIPMKTAGEWVTGTKSFLSKTPSNIRKGPCIDYSLTAKVWGRLGPPETPIFPYTLDPADFGITTLSTLGVATGGGTATKSGDKITYNVGTAFKNSPYLEKSTVTIPWTGIDFEGVPEAGTASIDVYGFYEGTWAYYLGERPVSEADNYYFQDASDVSTQSSTVTIFRIRAGSFDGDHVIHSLSHTSLTTNWVILIDRSIAARATYTLGASAGNPNGDSYSNTMLDAQINAAVDFINALYAWDAEDNAGVTLTSGNGIFEETKKTDGGPTVNIYTISSGLQYVDSGTITTTTIRDRLKASIKSITHDTASNVNFNSVFSTMRTTTAPELVDGGTNLVNVLVLSPGISNGTSFDTNLNALDNTGTGNYGFQFFGFRSGASNSVINNIDSTGTATALTAATSLRDKGIKYPISLSGYAFAIRNLANTGWEWLINPATGTDTFPVQTLLENPLTSYQGTFLRITSRTSFVCRTLYCGPDQLTPTTVTNESRIKANKGEKTLVGIRLEYAMVPGYTLYNMRFASDFNADNYHRRSVTYTLDGWYSPSPP